MPGRIAPVTGVLALGGILLAAIVANQLATIDLPGFFDDPELSLVTLLAAALALIGYALRPLWAGTAVPFAPRVTIATYFILLLLGAAAVSALRILAVKGYPIAATQRLPTVEQTIHAFEIALLGGAFLLAGFLVSALPTGFSSRTSSMSLDDERTWSNLARAIPGLVGVGIAACLLVTAATGQVALFASDVDATRYQQGSGLGFASLLQYELLLVACISVAGLVLTSTRRTLWITALTTSLAALIVFRAERTPLLVTALMLVFTVVIAGKRAPRTAVLVLAVATVAAIAGLGLVRFVSATSVADQRAAVTRPLFDLAPEFREQAFVYDVYPQLHGHTAARDLKAIASSVVPGRLLAIAGVDKQALYTDVSRDYAATMRQLGYYPYNEKPLRVGLVGELYADFGIAGVIVGLLAFGVALSRFPAAVRGPAHLMKTALLGVFTVLLLVTPPPALLPIALIVVGTLALLTAPRFARGTGP